LRLALDSGDYDTGRRSINVPSRKPRWPLLSSKARRQYVRLHSRHPTLAAASGIHVWDAELEDYSALALSAEINAIKSFQERFEKIPPLELRLSDTFDYQILASNIRARLLELEHIQSYERNPQVYNEPISTGLLQLAMFEAAPAETRLRQVIAKEARPAIAGFRALQHSQTARCV
jgi:hypothetical protein